MKLVTRSLLLLSTLFPVLASQASATTYQMVSDQALADQAAMIVDVEVSAVEPAPEADGRPATDYLVEIQRVIKGSPAGSSIVVRVPGGIRSDGRGLKLWGAPMFEQGERALLFLRPADDGTYRVLHLMLGAFHQRVMDGRRVAFRDLSEAREVTPSGVEARLDLIRDSQGFSQWLEDRARGIERSGDYVLAPSSGPARMTEEFRLMTYTQTGKNIRWFTFDSGGTVAWRVNTSGQPGLGLDRSIAAFRVGIEAWNTDPGSNVRYNYAGTTTASAGFDHDDGVNTILFNDPRGDADGTFVCGEGGVIAVGGPYFDTATRVFQGTEYHETVEADIVVNDGTECYFNNNATVAEEVWAHELGHTLGLSHTGITDALMRAFAHNDGRGARLHSDDRAGAAALYPANTPPPTPVPAAPTELAAVVLSSTQVSLTWKDNSSDEQTFRVETKVAGGSFQQAASVAANTTTTVLNGLKAGTEYVIRVRAANKNGFSAFTNNVRVTTTAATGLGAPTSLVATPRSGSEVFLTWKDNAAGEVNVRIEQSVNGGAFQEVGVALANETGALVQGLTPGTSYSFRVRAGGADRFSEYSNTAAAATLAPSPAVTCPDGGRTLCLGNFQIEVFWRNQHNGGQSGNATAVKRTEQSGTFWFFDSASVELIVKVLDGRPVNGAWWVYGASQTDLEYWIRVRDTRTGAIQLYHNRPGEIRGFGDTAAFRDGDLADTQAVLQVREIAGISNAAAPTTGTAAGAAGACSADGDTLCLLGGRYKVEVRWKNQYAGGAEGVGMMIPNSDNTGFVWFFDPSNIELAVKVLDGTGVNGKKWVFYGSLSDVEYWVEVTDTVTGQKKTYHNRPGSLAGVADTGAF